MAFDQENHPRIRFVHNPLKVVVAQVRFPAAYSLADPAGLAAFQAAIRDEYTVPMPRGEQFTVTVGPGGGGQQVGPGPAKFADASQTRIMTVTEEWVSYETTAYESWEDFRARFERLLNVISTQIQPTHVTRLGLRYVDEIVVDGARTPSDWQAFITPSLLGVDDSPLLDERAVRGFQQISLLINQDAVNVRHGYTRNEVAADPASTYVIDTDLFTQRDQPWDIDALLGQVDRYHTWAWNLFIRSLTPLAVERLGGEEVV